MSEAMGALAGVMGNVVTVANSIKSAFEALSNPDLNGWEKMSAVMSSVALVVPNVMSSLKGLGTLTSFANDQALKYIASKKSEAAATLAAAAAEKVDATMTAISDAAD